MLNKIYNENCIDTMAKMPNEFIDLTITSPPYDNLRKYKKHTFNFKEIANELYRITKQNRVLVWIVGDATINGSETGTSFKQALYFKKIGFSLHDTMIYCKKTPIPQFKAHRYTNAFEYMFVFSKGKPTHGELLTIPCKLSGRTDKNYRGQVDKNYNYVGKDIKVIRKKKLLTNIRTYSQNNDIDKSISHKSQFPETLVREHIISWSNENDIVYDPLIGSGTTAKIAILNNRNYIGSEISKEYYEMAKKRIKKL